LKLRRCLSKKGSPFQVTKLTIVTSGNNNPLAAVTPNRLYPVIVSDVGLCLKLLNQRGVDAYVGATQLQVIHAPVGSKFEEPMSTASFFNKVFMANDS
jgi:hypothetical protein